MPDRPAPPRATPSRDLDHREVFARFVDRLAARLPPRAASELRPPQERTA